MKLKIGSRSIKKHNEEIGSLQVPKPVKAVLLLFPINEATEKARLAEEARLAASGQMVRFLFFVCGFVLLRNANDGHVWFAARRVPTYGLRSRPSETPAARLGCCMRA